MKEFYMGDTLPTYVQEWRDGGRDEPSDSPSPIALFVPGGAHTGTCWTSTPDGRQGWAQQFARAGWTSLVLDWSGTGRSPRDPAQSWSGAEPIILGLAEVLELKSISVIVAHSIGAPLALRALEVAGVAVDAAVLIAPSAPGNVPRAPVTEASGPPALLPRQLVLTSLANSSNFPRRHIPEYLRSLCLYDYSVGNACGSSDGSDTLVIRDVEAQRRRRNIVVIGDEDALTPEANARQVADFLQADFIRLDRDWAMPGFGHMMQIERGSETVAGHILEWLGGHR